MILHLQGIHSASEIFLKNFRSVFPEKNIVLRFHNEGNGVTVLNQEKEEQYDDIDSFARVFDFSKISVVVVYFLDFKKEVFLNKYIPKDIPIIWWMYGGDLYGPLYLKGYELFAPQTIPYVEDKRRGIIRRIKRYINRCYKAYYSNRILKRIKGVVPCEKPDYSLACWLLGRVVDHVDIYPRDDMPQYVIDNGNDICVGHSASLSVNHLYALDILKKVDIQDSCVVLPLSYTIHSEEYRQSVVREYKKVFGNKVKSIFEYQDLETYEKGFLNYKVAIYPSWRQEALGNIFICFNLGVKVFLSCYNPCYDFFKEQGYCIYALEDIKSSEDLSPLTQEKKELNRKIYERVKQERAIVAPENLKVYFSRYV